MQFKRFNHKIIQNLITQIFIKVGLTVKDAKICSYSLVRSDLRGVWSHGISRTSIYCKRIIKKVANSKPNLKIKFFSPSIAHLNGNNGLGFIVADRAIDESIKMAKKNGIGLVAVSNSNHFGMAALYLEKAIKNNCMSWIFTNASPALPPHGAMAPHFGTSPFAFGCPTNKKDSPFILDMATSSVARGKLKFAAQRGEKIPYGLALDKNGNPTNDGFKAFEGIMLPFGGMKGAGLSWMMDIVGGVFTGANFNGKVKNAISNFSGPSNVGHVFICVKSNIFQKNFNQRMMQGIKTAKQLKLAKGFKTILHPGEPEAIKLKENLKKGIPISPDIVADLKNLAQSLDIKVKL